MKKFKLIYIFLFIVAIAKGQSKTYTTSNAHSHNDYENPIPFYTAYDQGFGSIEADVFYYRDSLLVGHVLSDILKKKTLEDLYLNPLNNKIRENRNFPYKDSTKSLQLLIDIKTDPIITLNKIVEVLNKYPKIIECSKIKIVITGNRPNQNTFNNYPNYVYFDGDLDKIYTSQELSKIGLFSADFTLYTNWNGKGKMIKNDGIKIDSIINAVHLKNKKIRFWASPDYINAWQQFIKLKIDYINTDHINELAHFLNNLSNTNSTIINKENVYKPQYINDGIDEPVSKIILLIGDGCSLPQWYAGYTGNGGMLSVFNIKHIGLSKTSSSDNYVTDSAPGASSIATGEKIENRHLGITPKGEKLKLITDILAERKFKIGLASSGDVSDATPAAFFAYAKDRDSSIEILSQLNNSNVQILAGGGNDKINKISILQKKSNAILNNRTLSTILPKYQILNSIDDSSFIYSKQCLVLDKKAGLSIQEGRDDWLSNTFDKIQINFSRNNYNKYFLMMEAAQIDYGGHANNIDYVAKEVIDFDKLISKALKYADENKGTLVIITGDHETGGLTLIDGDYATQTISGQFSTNDHTGIPVPVFSYGYRSFLFDGVYENTSLFNKIIMAIK